MHQLTPDDKFLIMATDGLWDELSRKTAANIANDLSKTQSVDDKLFKDALMKKLLECALTNAARNSRMTLKDLNKVRPGKVRREIVDDISLFVVDLTN